MSQNHKDQSTTFDSATYARSAERLMRALEIAYEMPAAHADELCEAVRVFVTQRKALGTPPESVVRTLRQLTLRCAPHRQHWGAYGVLSAAVVRLGMAAYHCTV
jgi:hypothetical protein